MKPSPAAIGVTSIDSMSAPSASANHAASMSEIVTGVGITESCQAACDESLPERPFDHHPPATARARWREAPRVPYRCRMRSRSILAGLAALGSVIGATFVATVAVPATPVAAAGTTSAYVAMPVSQRLIDTRANRTRPGRRHDLGRRHRRRPTPGARQRHRRRAQPDGHTTVGPGFWTVWPHTSPRPVASNLNVDENQFLAGNVTPNLVTVPVGSDGVVDIYGSAGGNVVVDLLGYYAPADSATSGRFEPLPKPTACSTRAGSPPSRPVRRGRSPCPAPPERAPWR